MLDLLVQAGRVGTEMSNCICLDVDDSCYYDVTSAWKLSDGSVRCVECRELIPAGEKFLEEDCFKDDLDADDCPENPEFDTYTTCLVCSKVRDDYFQCGWWYGMVWEDLDDNLESDDDCYRYRIIP